MANEVVKLEFFHKGRKVKAQRNSMGWEVFIFEPNGTPWPGSTWYKSNLSKADVKKSICNFIEVA